MPQKPDFCILRTLQIPALRSDDSQCSQNATLGSKKISVNYNSQRHKIRTSGSRKISSFTNKTSLSNSQKERRASGTAVLIHSENFAVTNPTCNLLQ